jgi:hypothetical protein
MAIAEVSRRLLSRLTPAGEVGLRAICWIHTGDFDAAVFHAAAEPALKLRRLR